MKQFEAPALLANEIKRCKNSIKFELIKFANIKDNIVTIATDDQETYNLLNQDWKPDAFLLGIKFLRDQKPKTFTMIIKGVHESVNLSEKSVIDQLKIQGLINAKRIIRKNNTQTTLVKADATNKEAYKAALEKKIKIFFTLHKAEPFKTITQCFKCQKVGHTHYNCSEVKNVCLKCSGNHRLNECKEKSPKCSNCNGDHVACSRLCPYLKEESKKVIQISVNKNDHNPTTRTFDGDINYATIASLNTVHSGSDHVKINQIIITATTMFIDQITKLMNSLFTKLINNVSPASTIPFSGDPHPVNECPSKHLASVEPMTATFIDSTAHLLTQQLQSFTGQLSNRNTNTNNV